MGDMYCVISTNHRGEVGAQTDPGGLGPKRHRLELCNDEKGSPQERTSAMAPEGNLDRTAPKPFGGTAAYGAGGHPCGRACVPMPDYLVNLGKSPFQHSAVRGRRPNDATSASQAKQWSL